MMNAPLNRGAPPRAEVAPTPGRPPFTWFAGALWVALSACSNPAGPRPSPPPAAVGGDEEPLPREGVADPTDEGDAGGGDAGQDGEAPRTNDEGPPDEQATPEEEDTDDDDPDPRDEDPSGGEGSADDEDDPDDGQDPADDEDDPVEGENADLDDPPADPSTEGPYTFTQGVAEDIDATLYLPDGEGPFPVVVLSHGFQLGPTDYASYGEHLASWGYVTVLPQLPGGLFGGPTHTQLKGHLASVLDWIEGEPPALRGVADSSSLGLAGHSMGGKISLLLATEDDRPDVVFGIDPVDAAPPMGGSPEDYPSVAPELMDDIDTPLFLVGELKNADDGLFGQSCAPRAENFQAYYEAATSPSMEVEIIGASHMSFLDDPACPTCAFCPAGTDDPARTRALTRTFMTAFFESRLRGARWPDAWLGGDALDDLRDEGLVSARSKNGF